MIRTVSDRARACPFVIDATELVHTRTHPIQLARKIQQSGRWQKSTPPFLLPTLSRRNRRSLNQVKLLPSRNFINSSRSVEQPVTGRHNLKLDQKSGFVIKKRNYPHLRERSFSIFRRNASNSKELR